jgi:hypothetical protein
MPMPFEKVEATGELMVLLKEIFNEEFMLGNTRFESFAAFRYSSAVIVPWEAAVWIYNVAVFDAFVRESTRFSSWEAMVKAAADLRYDGFDTLNHRSGEKNGKT